jgi:hypothetical protein
MGQREEELQKRVLCLAGWVKKNGNKRRQKRRRSKADNITNIFFSVVVILDLL